MTQKVLLTGASGYIARHICLALLNAGHRVRGSVRALDKGEEVRAALRPHLTDPDALERLEFVALDLSQDAGWTEALDGIDVLMHTASPFPFNQPKDESDLIRPAVDGTLRALKAAHEAGVKRAIMTSSTVALTGAPLPDGKAMLDESCWTDVNRPDTSAYTKSKTLAERAAWDFVRGTEMALTTVNPGLVIGPALGREFGTSVGVIQRIMAAKDPAVPRFGMLAVDVRDVADLHLAAMDQPATAGQRIMGVERFIWFRGIAETIKEALPGRRIVTRQAPDWMVRVLAWFDPAIRSIVADLGMSFDPDNSRARAVLGRELRDARAAIAETARWLDRS